MRAARFLTVVAVLVALGLAMPALAGTTTKYITLYESAKISGKQLSPATYRVDITDDGKMTVKKGKEVVAEAKGEWVEGKTKAQGDTFVVDNGEVKEIRIEGRNKVFMIR